MMTADPDTDRAGSRYFGVAFIAASPDEAALAAFRERVTGLPLQTAAEGEYRTAAPAGSAAA